MSAQIFRMLNNEAKVKVNIFNEHANPRSGAVWNNQACVAPYDLRPSRNNYKC